MDKVRRLIVDKELADGVEQDLYSIRVEWSYYRATNNYYELAKTDEIRKDIDVLNERYGPIVDSQRFTQGIYNSTQASTYEKAGIRGFIDIRSNPKSKLNRNFPFVVKLINHLQQTYIPPDYKVERLMFNMQTIRPQWTMNAPHPDFLQKDHITILYYVNDSDGDTYFFDGQECIDRVSPAKGMAVMYPSCTMHAGSTPTKTDTRVVINMCFGPKPK